MDLQRVAGLGTFDVERAGLRIDLGEVELWRDRCVGDGERVVGGVTRAGDNRVPGLDAHGRRMGMAVSEINLVAWIVPHFGRLGRPGERKPGDRQQQRGRQQPQRLSRCSISLRHIRYLPRIFWLHFVCTLTRSLHPVRLSHVWFPPLEPIYFLGKSPRMPSLPGAPPLKYLLSKSTPNSGESAGSTMVVLLRAKVRDASMVRRNAKNSGARLSAFA